jgi:hypothetical protein
MWKLTWQASSVRPYTTVKKAEQSPSGRARDQPNRNPELRPPTRVGNGRYCPPRHRYTLQSILSWVIGFGFRVQEYA